DLRFINDTNGLIIIFADTTDNSVTFSVYGVENLYTYKTRSEILEEILPEDKIELVEVLLKGEQEQKVVGKSGFKSKGYLQKYHNGQLVGEWLIRSDEYKKIDNLILQGK
ncbi:MAG: G5 domain-containing protein, partial [Clostridia bacterium]|nr:G5 domain-containing protein [Clostridia bacterium]